MRPKHLALLFLSVALPASAAVDPFYLGLLREAQHAFERRDYAAAARDLRLACFGMLDEPRQLADCLVRLALAQDRINDLEGFRETFRRLVEIEDRFNAYSRSELAPDLRAALEQRLAARLPAATLEASPVFRSTTVRKSEPAPARASPPRGRQEGRTQQEERSRKDGPPPPTAAKRSPAPPAPAAADAAGATSAPPLIQVGPAGAKPLSPAELERLDQARRLLAEPHPAREVRQAFDLAREVADAHPEFKEAQHLAAEGAYRVSRWSDALRYFQRGGDPGDDKPERLFYMAVALHESGDGAAASTALRRALPHLKRTPYVDSYARKILGQ